MCQFPYGIYIIYIDGRGVSSDSIDVSYKANALFIIIIQTADCYASPYLSTIDHKGMNHLFVDHPCIKNVSSYCYY